jgi:hypothetical protein
MGSKVSIAEWDNNNKSLEFLQVRYTDVLGRFLARYLSMPADIEDFFKLYRYVKQFYHHSIKTQEVKEEEG